MDLQASLSGCRGVLVDSNVLLDVSTKDPVWGERSALALAQAADSLPLVINPIIHAEVSVGYSTIEALNAAVPPSLYRCEGLPGEAGFLAGKSFLLYRRRGGRRSTPLPDFYVGARAAMGPSRAANARWFALQELFPDSRNPGRVFGAAGIGSG